jgi:hypothetical protein
MWSCIGVVTAMVVAFGVRIAIDISARPDKFGNIQTSWTPLPASMPKDNRPFSGSFSNACQKVSEQEVQTYAGKTGVLPGKYSVQDDPVEGGASSKCSFDFPGGNLSTFVSQDPGQGTTTAEDDLKGQTDCHQFHIVENYNAPMSVCVIQGANDPGGLYMTVEVARAQNGDIRDASIYWVNSPGDPAGAIDKVTPRLEGLASLLAQRM